MSEITGWDPMTESTCLDAVNNGDETASELLTIANPKFRARFKRVDAAIVKLINDVQEYFPDAQYYTASGGFHLMLGSSHDRHGNGQQQLIALSGTAQIGDGDF